MLESYLTQLDRISKETGWSLKDACILAGIADTTYYRWRNGQANPRLNQAQKVAEFMTANACSV